MSAPEYDYYIMYTNVPDILKKSRRVRHRCGFAIALKQQYCDAGLGTAMMEYALSLAKAMGYEQVELEVVDGNDRAKHLYEKMGFKETGKSLFILIVSSQCP